MNKKLLPIFCATLFFLVNLISIELRAEGSNLKRVEKSLGIKSTKSKPPKNRSDLDKLYRDLNENVKKQESAARTGENIPPVNQDIVESIGQGNLRSMPYAKIVITNKITTKRQIETFKVGDVKFFGNLSIEINKCINDPNLRDPNNMMLLTIFDNKIDDDKLSVFHGWMISNNLSLSTLEHPVYEVIPIECLAELEKTTVEKKK